MSKPLARASKWLGGLEQVAQSGTPVNPPSMGGSQYPGLYTTKTAYARCQPPDSATMPAGGTYTLLDVAGAGYLASIFFAAMKAIVGGTYSADGCEKSRLKVYIDGEVTPSIDVLWVDLCCCRGANGNFDTTVTGRETDRFGWTFLSGTGTSFYINLIAPYSSHLKVVFVNGSATADVLIAASATYHSGSAMNWGKYGKLHIASLPGTSVSPDTDYAALNITAGNGGLLAGTYLHCQGGDGNLGYDEGYIDLYVDGTTRTNRYDSIEDYFKEGYYFAAGVQLTREIGCTYWNAGAGTQGAYRFHDTDAIPFASSLKVVVHPGVGTVNPQTNSIVIKGCLWWYEATTAASTPSLVKGDPGTNGSVIYSGAVVPDPTLGNAGDYYLNTATSDMYTKTGAGWGTPIVNIKGQQGVPGGSLAVGYAVDFSTLTPANLKTGGDGAKTIDGKAWALAQSANASSVWVNDGTHAGLYVRCSTTSTDDYATTYTGPRLVVGLSDLTGIKANAAAEMWVMVMFSQPHAPAANFEFSRIGIIQMPTNNGDVTGTYRRLSFARGYNSGNNTGMGYQLAGATTGQPASSPLPPFTDDVYAFRILANQRVEMYSGASVAGAFPNLSALSFYAAASFMSATPGFDALSIYGVSANLLQWALTVNVTTGNTAGNSDFLLKKLQVLYR